MGWANAQRYLLTGDQWTAAESHRLGLVQEVVPVGEQYAKAREIAERIARAAPLGVQAVLRSEEHTSELQSLMRISYAVFCLKKKTKKKVHCINIRRSNIKVINQYKTITHK